MSFETDLRKALVSAKEGKDISREAGAGVFANFVRATCYPVTPSNVEEFNNVCKRVVEKLNEIRELSKDEKNSLRSAKSVIGKAISNDVDVWNRDDDGTITHVDDKPMPKGKSELQEAKTDFERMMAFIDGATKKFSSESRESFTSDELGQLWHAIATLGDAVMQEKDAV